MADKTTRVRFAPSPTGFLHVGGLRTALFNFLFARNQKGQFVLRIEDTDKSREVPDAVENIIETLKTFGLNFDEGPIFQSQRLEIYQKHIQELITKDAAYKCYCSEERIAELKKQAEKEKRPFRYDKHCLRNSPQPSLWKKRGGAQGFVIRQNIPEEGITEFEDLVHGKVSIENRTLDDGILIKSGGWPVYNFANVVDDHLMGITHVIRGEEFIPSTPKHILLYQAFGWEMPKFAHLPLILDRNRKKLSKRTGDVAVKEYLEKGYLSEALLNFVAFLGWNPKTEQEIFELDELIKAFDLNKVNKAGAIFDIEKLDFINREWRKRLNLGAKDPLYQKTMRLLKSKFGNLSPTLSPRQGRGEGEGEKFFQKIWPLILERVKGPSELEDKLPEFYFFFEEPKYEAGLLIWKDTPKEKIKKNLTKVHEFLKNADSLLNLKSKILNLLSEQGIGTGETLWPLRVALTGLKASPGPFEIMEALLTLLNGKEIILKRIQKAIEKL